MTYCEYCQKTYVDKPGEYHITTKEHMKNLREPHIHITDTRRGRVYYIKYLKPGDDRKTVHSFSCIKDEKKHRDKCMKIFERLFPTKKKIIITKI